MNNNKSPDYVMQFKKNAIKNLVQTHVYLKTSFLNDIYMHLLTKLNTLLHVHKNAHLMNLFCPSSEWFLTSSNDNACMMTVSICDHR